MKINTCTLEFSDFDWIDKFRMPLQTNIKIVPANIILKV